MNLLFALPTAVAALRLLVNQALADRPPIDWLGTVTATPGLFALVYGFSNSETQLLGPSAHDLLARRRRGAADRVRVIEMRAAHPLLPLRVITDRTRGGSYLAIGISGIALFGVSLFLTYFLQQTKGFSPVQTGLAFLPMTAAIVIDRDSVNAKLPRRVGPRPLMTLGMPLQRRRDGLARPARHRPPATPTTCCRALP